MHAAQGKIIDAAFARLTSKLQINTKFIFPRSISFDNQTKYDDSVFSRPPFYCCCSVFQFLLQIRFCRAAPPTVVMTIGFFIVKLLSGSAWKNGGLRLVLSEGMCPRMQNKTIEFLIPPTIHGSRLIQYYHDIEKYLQFSFMQIMTSQLKFMLLKKKSTFLALCVRDQLQLSSLNIRCFVERTQPFQNGRFSTRVDNLVKIFPPVTRRATHSFAIIN